MGDQKNFGNCNNINKIVLKLIVEVWCVVVSGVGRLYSMVSLSQSLHKARYEQCI